VGFWEVDGLLERSKVLSEGYLLDHGALFGFEILNPAIVDLHRIELMAFSFIRHFFFNNFSN